MSLTSGDLVAQLQGIEPDVTVLEHEKVLTVEAWEKAFEGKNVGNFAIAKNLFFKVSRRRVQTPNEKERKEKHFRMG